MMEQQFPDEIKFNNQQGIVIRQGLTDECKPIHCGDCRGVGHTAEECRQEEV